MENQRVHEYTVENGSNGLPIARLGKVHNLITFISSGAPKVHYLDGRWVDDGGNLVPEDQVPENYKLQVSKIPFDGRTDRTPDVLIDCEFCADSLPSREYARHLADKHIRTRTEAVVTAAAAAPGVGRSVDPDLDTQPAKLRPEDLPPGNYVLDDQGFVVLNADGSARKRAGRPRNTPEE